MKVINTELWPRKPLFDFFSSISNPFYSVTFTQDVTELYEYTHAHGLSFYYALIYLATKAVNAVDAFHYAIRDGEVVRLEVRSPSFTDLKKGADLFHIVTMPCRETMDEFCAAAKSRSEAQTQFICAESEGIDLIYFTCLPWVEVTSLTNERDFNPDDAIPRIAWGKYRDENGRKTLGISLELNHRFTDGAHIGAFASELTKLIQELQKT